MQHLVISVSPDSSLKLLGECADIIVLDKKPPIGVTKRYDTLYIRSHFSQPDLQPQNFRHEITPIVDSARRINPGITFIDSIDNVDDIVFFEDKWRQYQLLHDFMPLTQLLDTDKGALDFKKQIFKKRLSSRGNGVTWDINDVTGSPSDWVVQESLEIEEEMRVYVVHGSVYPIATARRSMTSLHKTEATNSRALDSKEVKFAAMISGQIANFDFVGLDIARTKDGSLKLMEANRSPGFASFAELTGVNLAHMLYSDNY